MTLSVSEVVARSPAPTEKRALGAFYTPDPVALILVRWALEPGSGPVLDPCFGGCAFLKAAVSVLAEQGADSSFAVAVDIDEKCRPFANALVPEANSRISDFLAVSPKDLPHREFAAVVGNPPFVRHHWLKGAPRTNAARAAAAQGVNLPGRASAWAYFVLHALAFLRPGGRLAMIVPEAILQTDYASPVRDRLAAVFATTRLIHVQGRLFAGTDEPIVVIAADGVGPGNIEVSSIASADGLVEALHTRAAATAPRPLTPAAEALIRRALAHPATMRVSDVATTRIGTVTGANHFFVISQAEARERGLPRGALRPIVGRTRFLTGLSYRTSDHDRLAADNQRVLLVGANKHAEHPRIQRWVADGVGLGLADRYKCAGRDPWFAVVPVPAPALFGTCSRAGSPRLVVNETRATCTNALHALTLKNPGADAKALAAGFLSSLTALCAERDGRRYGGGLLKIEPGAFAKLPIIAGASVDLDRVDQLLRAEREDEARRVVDAAVLAHQLGFTDGEIRCLQQAVLALSAMRSPS